MRFLLPILLAVGLAAGSATPALAQEVTRTTLSASPSPSTVGQSVTLTAAVTVPSNLFAAPDPATGLATGKIAAGMTSTCAVLESGGVKCWGEDDFGKLGDGSDIGDAKTVPVDVIDLDGSTPAKSAAAIAVGNYHSCALLKGGAVMCWGRNNYGQLGDGAVINGDTANQSIPVAVSGLGGVAVAIAAGHYHTCALLDGGAVKCWGLDGFGQLGDGGGTNASKSTPVAVTGLGGAATAIAAGWDHTCALITDGSVKCWGWDGYGQLGDGGLIDDFLAYAPAPVLVSGLGGTGIVIAAGGNQTCAVIEAGPVTCWGNDGWGQLGDGVDDSGNNASRSTPVAVSNLGGANGPKVITIATGYSHTCAVVEGGLVTCWGGNFHGQLGDDDVGANKSSPVAVSYINGTPGNKATAIATGGNHTCALIDSGEAMCWGQDGDGQLGDGVDAGGANTNQPTPVSVFRPTPTGTVTFKDSATALGAPVPLVGGVATLDKALPPGLRLLTATFEPDTVDFAPSASSALKHLVTGTAGADTLRGTAGIDVLVGMAGNDTLFGLAGNDTLSGGDGADKLDGGKGKDALTGGTGNDSFIFRLVSDSPAKSPDVITDFKSGDRIDLSRFDGNTKMRRAQRFTTWRGTQPFTRKPGEIRFVRRGAKLEGDTNGDGRADFRVILKGVTKLPPKAVKLK